jgi:hypothetical protein
MNYYDFIKNFKLKENGNGHWICFGPYESKMIYFFSRSEELARYDACEGLLMMDKLVIDGHRDKITKMVIDKISKMKRDKKI